MLACGASMQLKLCQSAIITHASTNPTVRFDRFRRMQYQPVRTRRLGWTMKCVNESNFFTHSQMGYVWTQMVRGMDLRARMHTGSRARLRTCTPVYLV